jgi:hypothetical protein
LPALAIIPGLAAAGKALFGQGTRMAASKLFKKALFDGMTKGQIAQRLAPDAILVVWQQCRHLVILVIS